MGRGARGDRIPFEEPPEEDSMKIMQIAMLVGALAGASALVPSEAHAALNAYLQLKGQKTGDIKTKSAKAGDGSVKVLSFNYGIVSPRDPASGQATGKRVHKPFIVRLAAEEDITKILIGLLQSGERLDGTFTAKKKGKDYMKIELKDCYVTSYSVETNDAGDDVIVLELVYQKIDGSYADGSVFLSEVVKSSSKPAIAPKPSAKASQ
jgi:type VI secretion system Hcp family effector